MSRSLLALLALLLAGPAASAGQQTEVQNPASSEEAPLPPTPAATAGVAKGPAAAQPGKASSDKGERGTTEDGKGQSRKEAGPRKTLRARQLEAEEARREAFKARKNEK